MTPVSIIPTERVVLAASGRRWRWSDANRPRIDKHFSDLRSSHPDQDLWNGPVFLLHRFSVGITAFVGEFFATDYASFVCWRDKGFPDTTVTGCVGMGALRSGDGAYVLGVMSKFTAHHGSIYFAAGFPDPADVDADGSIDLFRSALRELEEETGVPPTGIRASDGWHAIVEEHFVTLVKTVTAAQSAECLRSQIRQYIAQRPRSELEDVHIVRRPQDLDARIPGYLRAFLLRALATTHL